jgi:hypothetical protein
MPKSVVGKSLELIVCSLLHSHHTCCSFVLLFFIGYYKLFRDKSGKLYICPCACAFHLTDLHLIIQRLLISVPVKSKAEFWECGHQVPCPNCASGCASSANPLSCHDHHVAGGNRIFLTVASPQKWILHHCLGGSSQRGRDKLHLNVLNKQ